MKNILVVDNDRIFLKLMERLLEKKGHHVETAEDGLNALDILEDYIPDIIFVDLVMPNIDGRMLCRIIRGMDKFDNTPIIILSATSAEEFPDFSRIEVNACIAKGTFGETAQNVLSVLNQSDLESSRYLPGNVVGADKVTPRGITKELLSANRHFEIVLDRMSEGVLEINEKGRILYANSAASLLTGMSETDLLGSFFVELFSGDDHRRLYDLLKEGEKKLKTIPYDHPARLNEYLITLDIIPLVEDETGSIIILHDITERKKVEEALRKAHDELERRVTERTSELVNVNRKMEMEIEERKKAQQQIKAEREYTQSLIDSSLDMIISVDNKRRIVEFNHAAEKTFGYGKNEVLGEKVDILYLDPGTGEGVHKIIRKTGAYTGEVTNVRKNGTRFRCLLSATLLMDAVGRVIGNMGISRDIEEKRRIEEEREILIDDLQKALKEIKTLRGILPTCSFCKKIRDDKGYWEQVDVYIHKYSEAEISHSVCPECAKEHYPDLNLYGE